MEVPLLVRDDSSSKGSSFVLPSSDLDTEAFRSSTVRTWLFVLCCVLSFGIVYLLTRWSARLRCKLSYIPCDMRHAQHVLIHERRPKVGEPGSSVAHVSMNAAGSRFFIHKGLLYSYSDSEDQFINHVFVVDGKSFASIHQLNAEGGMRTNDRNRSETIYGRNELHVPNPPILELVLDEVLTPFYIFQVFSIVIWLVQLYWIYATAIFVLATAGLIYSVWMTRQNTKRLIELAHHASTVTVLRGTKHVIVDSVNLVPGDVILLEGSSNARLPCDCILLSGECIVNESSLTGETVPVIKASLPVHGGQFSLDHMNKHVLFNGTMLCQTRGENPLALVVRTGYQTSKGELIRQILFPKTSAFHFFRDAMVYIGVLTLACLGFVIWSATTFSAAGAGAYVIAIRTLDLFTVLIPPALPIAITAGISFAIARLRSLGVFCIVPKTVALAGRVNLFCFDKTGTLTADHLTVAGVVPVDRVFCQAPVTNIASVTDPALLYVLTSCHSVAKLAQGELVGDPMEIKMIQWTNWNLSAFEAATEATMTSPDGRQTIRILKRHEFNSMVARMSVVIESPDKTKMVVCKGSPKEVVPRCVTGLTADLQATIDQYSALGMRVIALASRPLGSANAEIRDQVECDLQFVGLLVLRNPVKPESFDVISQLRAAKIRPVMITGDSALTAISVANSLQMTSSATTVLVEGNGTMAEVTKETMLPPVALSWDEIMANGWDIALTGSAFDRISQWDSPELSAILERTVVFARTNPLQKAEIIGAYKKGGYIVGMVGDGANDCGALKTADAGVSISDGEAAMAAPFTASSVTSVIQIILEGRCALATTHSLFKFMIMYSIVQFTGIMLCYTGLSLFSDLQFLWIDLFCILSISATLGLSPPVDKLVPLRPPGSMLCWSSFFSVIGHTTIAVIPYYVVITNWAAAQTWWVPSTTLNPNGSWNTTNMLVTLAWKIGNFLYLAFGFSYAIGRPWRQPFWWNPGLMLALVALTACNIAWFFVTNPTVLSIWSLVLIPDATFMRALFGIILAICVTIYAWEVIMVNVLLKRDSQMKN